MDEAKSHHHVKVVEAPGSRILSDARGSRRDPDNRGPVIPVVHRHSPRVPVVGSPGPDIIPAPLAQRKEDGPANGFEGIVHCGVPRLRVPSRRSARLDHGPVARRVAVVVLPVVDAPGRKRLRVLDLVALRAWVAPAGLGAGTTVQTKLEAHAVDLVCDGFDAVGPFGGVGDQVSRGIPRKGAPAVVDVDVGVAEVFEAERDEGVGGRQGVAGRGGIALGNILAEG